jgi:hypothetical protein
MIVVVEDGLEGLGHTNRVDGARKRERLAKTLYNLLKAMREANAPKRRCRGHRQPTSGELSRVRCGRSAAYQRSDIVETGIDRS